ncbi:Gfo/Idh/MocA family protein [Microbacterium gilvum]|uniref:Gfo/Idh/MocA-like oxidoreductase N-terminal domain-containing protein n=1 Tax=Microbacterium gilvum TaxID=1336204 RepID=A0ABP9AP11_9MICO
MPTGVGIIGAGPGAWALHAPTLARLGRRFALVHVADGGSGRAEAIAARSGARASSDAAELLGDPGVDVVVIASPPERHAAHALAAVSAGKRAILCEKPLATTHDDVDAVVAACRSAGVALVVGTHHLHDPAWAHVRHHLTARGAAIRDISLPPNDRYHAAVSEAPLRALCGGAPRSTPPDAADPRVAADIVRRLVGGLCVHDVPLLRDLAPALDRMAFARLLPPVGCALGFVASGALVQIGAAMTGGGAEALWHMSIGAGDDRIDIDFPPAFVHDGSATVTVTHADGRVVRHERDAVDGHTALWRALASQLDRTQPVEYDEIAADAHHGVLLADAAARAVRTPPARTEREVPARDEVARDEVAPDEVARDEAVPDEAVRESVDPSPGASWRIALPTAGDAADRFRVAAAELPLTIAGSATASTTASGTRAERVVLVRDGEETVVLPEPAGVDAAQLAGLHAVVERARVRPLPEAAERAAREAVAVVVEAALPVSDPAPWLRDAVGWCRLLAGPLTASAVEATATSLMAAFDGATGAPVTLIATETAGPSRITARTLGPVRLEAVVQTDGTAIRIATAEGELLLPPRRESAAREALRRAAQGADDIADLRHDERLRAQLTERPST